MVICYDMWLKFQNSKSRFLVTAHFRTLLCVGGYSPCTKTSKVARAAFTGSVVFVSPRIKEEVQGVYGMKRSLTMDEHESRATPKKPNIPRTKSEPPVKGSDRVKSREGNRKLMKIVVISFS